MIQPKPRDYRTYRRRAIDRSAAIDQILGRMADVVIEKHRPGALCSDQDFMAAGFTADLIQQHSNRARERATHVMRPASISAAPTASSTPCSATRRMAACRRATKTAGATSRTANGWISATAVLYRWWARPSSAREFSDLRDRSRSHLGPVSASAAGSIGAASHEGHLHRSYD